MKLPAALRLPPEAAPHVFLSPFVVLFAVFGVFPLVFSLYLAFQSWEPTGGLGAMQFVGLDIHAFASQDEWFWKSMKNTAWLALASGVPQQLVAIPLACFIHASFERLRNGVVGACFMPYITSTAAIAILFSALFSTDHGPIRRFVMRSPEMHTLPLALRGLQSPVNTEWGALMAGSAIATPPLVVLFALSSRQLVAGLTTGAVK